MLNQSWPPTTPFEKTIAMNNLVYNFVLCLLRVINVVKFTGAMS